MVTATFLVAIQMTILAVYPARNGAGSALTRAPCTRTIGHSTVEMDDWERRARELI